VNVEEITETHKNQPIKQDENVTTNLQKSKAIVAATLVGSIFFCTCNSR